MKDKIVVYGEVGGFPSVLSFLGGKWWLTSKDDVLLPFFEENPQVKYGYRYLCEADETIQMKDLAMMMGKVMMFSELDTEKTLEIRMKELDNLGVKINVAPYCMNLTLHLLSTDGTDPTSKFSMYAYSEDIEDEVFDLDGFDSAEEAVQYAQIYIDFFKKHGATFNTILSCEREIAKTLLGKTPQMMLEIRDKNE